MTLKTSPLLGKTDLSTLAASQFTPCTGTDNDEPQTLDAIMDENRRNFAGDYRGYIANGVQVDPAWYFKGRRHEKAPAVLQDVEPVETVGYMDLFERLYYQLPCEDYDRGSEQRASYLAWKQEFGRRVSDGMEILARVIGVGIVLVGAYFVASGMLGGKW